MRYRRSDRGDSRALISATVQAGRVGGVQQVWPDLRFDEDQAARPHRVERRGAPPRAGRRGLWMTGTSAGSSRAATAMAGGGGGREDDRGVRA